MSKENKGVSMSERLESHFSDIELIGWAHLTPDGRVLIDRVHDKPELLSVPLFLPKDKLDQFEKYAKEKKDEKEL